MAESVSLSSTRVVFVSEGTELASSEGADLLLPRVGEHVFVAGVVYVVADVVYTLGPKSSTVLVSLAPRPLG